MRRLSWRRVCYNSDYGPSPSKGDCVSELRIIVKALEQRFSNFFQVGTTFISQNVVRTTLLLGLSISLGLP